jgi:hypothetical protein
MAPSLGGLSWKRLPVSAKVCPKMQAENESGGFSVSDGANRRAVNLDLPDLQTREIKHPGQTRLK